MKPRVTPVRVKPVATAATIDVYFGRWPSDMPSDGAISRLRDAHDTVRESWKRTAAAYEANMKNPLRPALGNLSAARAAADKSITAATKAADAALAAARSELSELDSEAERAIRCGDSAMAAEIRGWLRSLPSSDRDKALRGAISSGELMIVQAALSAPSGLTGLNGANRELFRAEFLAKVKPELVARTKNLRRAIEVSEKAGSSLLRRYAEVFDHEELNQAEAAARAAEAA